MATQATILESWPEHKIQGCLSGRDSKVAT
jgi:hypothetical protein